MKKLIVLFAAAAMFASCQKSNLSTPKPLAENYFYKIIDRDLDDSTTTTQIYLVKGGAVSTNSVLNTGGVLFTQEDSDNTPQTTHSGDDGGDDDHKCKNHKLDDDKKCSAMPVTFINVSFVRDGYNVTATWTAATESNVKQYEIMRSTDGKTFSIVGLVAPRGAGTTYTYIDNLSK